EKLAARHDALYLGGSTLAQHALALALQKNDAALRQYATTLRQTLSANEQMLREAFALIGMEPLPVPGAYYMLIKHNRGSDEAAMIELQEKKIATVPVNMLRADRRSNTGHIRIHFGVRPETAEKVRQLLAN
ncbi:MAG TPA: aminotransferase class I/II-fold pyridoxal phosphate-dependent enzyme, partial [Candidatus Andersenbacteria bacterium]|nr:aminotransferase class I/II-fold pyridoxal phosphate-dependent enzyme [Candidatus Andersenbacteria bacterium]